MTDSNKERNETLIPYRNSKTYKHNAENYNYNCIYTLDKN